MRTNRSAAPVEPRGPKRRCRLMSRAWRSPGKVDPPWLIPYERENPTNGNSARGSADRAECWCRDTAVTAALAVPELRPIPPAPVAQNTAAPPTEMPANARIYQSGQSVIGSFPAGGRDPGHDALRIFPADPVPADSLSADPMRNPLQNDLADRSVCARRQASALSLGFCKESPGVAGDGKNPSQSPGGVAGATMAKAAGKYLPGDGGRHPSAGDFRLGHSTGRDARLPATQRRRRTPPSRRPRLSRS